MAAGDINDPLSNIPNIVLVNQSVATAAPGAGYGRLEIVDGVLGIRMETGAWVPMLSLTAGLLTALDEKAVPAATDLLLLQDEAEGAGSALKKAQVGNLPGGEGGGTITTQSVALTGANVSLSNAGFTNILTMSCGPGTWVFHASVLIQAAVTSTTTLRIYDGSTALAAASQTVGAGYYANVPLLSLPTVLATTTSITLDGKTQASLSSSAAMYQSYEGSLPATVVLVGIRVA